ncbi:MAG: hypothetical protein ACRCZS_09280 [Chroococcidiopsis sp.]
MRGIQNSKFKIYQLWSLAASHQPLTTPHTRIDRTTFLLPTQ